MKNIFNKEYLKGLGEAFMITLDPLSFIFLSDPKEDPDYPDFHLTIAERRRRDMNKVVTVFQKAVDRYENTDEVSVDYTAIPSPKPIFLNQIETLAPGAAKKIIDDMMAELKHSRQMESKQQQKYWQWRFSQVIISGVITIFLPLLAVVLILDEHAVAGLSLCSITLVPLIRLFLSVEKRKERNKRGQKRYHSRIESKS